MSTHSMQMITNFHNLRLQNSRKLVIGSVTSIHMKNLECLPISVVVNLEFIMV